MPIIKNKKTACFAFSSIALCLQWKEQPANRKKASDTIGINPKVKPVKKNNENWSDQHTENASKSRVVGKTFVGKLSHSCRATTNGAYDIYIFLHLSFDQDSVTVTQQVVDTETHIIDEKVYPWKMLENEVIIDHFDDYGKLQLKKDRLISTKYDGSTIEFLNSNVHHFNR